MTIVIHALTPRRQAQDQEQLRLYLERNIEILCYAVYPERNSGDGPREHHYCRQTIRPVTTIVLDNLRDQLYAPTHLEESNRYVYHNTVPIVPSTLAAYRKISAFT